jgi:hypothetical protein
MSEFDNLQRIIRLKRFETPGEDFVEDFVARFRERQRSELLRQSARGLLWERMVTFWEDLVSPRWTMAAATTCMALLATWGAFKISGSHQDASIPNVLAVAEPVPAALSSQPSLAVQSELIREVEQGRQLEIEGILLSRHFDGHESPVAAAEGVVGVSGDALPVSVELLPIDGIIR